MLRSLTTTVHQSTQTMSKLLSVTTTPCKEWPKARNQYGYGVRWYEGRLWAAHRLAWIEAGHTIPDGMCVLHKCDNPACINADHLFIGTQRDNVTDMITKGRDCRGEDVRHSKLTEDDVRMIRRLAKDGWPLTEIAQRYPVGRPAISLIVHRHRWRHV